MAASFCSKPSSSLERELRVPWPEPIVFCATEFEAHKDQVQPLFTIQDMNMSYPSGHASGAELQARLLASLFHDNGQDVLLMQRAKQIADGRVIAGVHYPSDVNKGKMLGDLVFAQLEADYKFVLALYTAAKDDNIPGQ